MLTDDENIVDLQFAVQYLVKDARDFVFNVRRPDDSAMQIAETAMREVIGKSRMDAILYETQIDVANRARELMQTIHDRYGTGITVSTVTIQNAQPPEQVQAAFDDAVKAGQDRERQKNEGQAYANDVIPRARGAASRLKEEAEGYRSRVVATAEGDASRFRQVLTEYAKAPAVTRERIYIETMQQVLSSTSKIMMDYRGAAGRAGAALARDPAQPRAGGPMKAAGPVVAILIVLAALISGTVFTVDQRQNAIVFQLGEVREVIQKPGLHFKIPLLQNVRLFDMRILTYDDADPLRFLTQGNRPVLVDSFVKWRINDVRQYYVSVQGDEARAATRIRQTVSGVLRDEFGARALHDVVSGERETIMSQVRQKVDQDLERIGVKIVDVRLKRVDLPRM
jgi:HflK protein